MREAAAVYLTLHGHSQDEAAELAKGDLMVRSRARGMGGSGDSLERPGRNPTPSIESLIL